MIRLLNIDGGVFLGVLRTLTASFYQTSRKLKKVEIMYMNKPVYVKSNRKDSQSAKINVLSSSNNWKLYFSIFNQ